MYVVKYNCYSNIVQVCHSKNPTRTVTAISYNNMAVGHSNNNKVVIVFVAIMVIVCIILYR